MELFTENVSWIKLLENIHVLSIILSEFYLEKNNLVQLFNLKTRQKNYLWKMYFGSAVFYLIKLRIKTGQRIIHILIFSIPNGFALSD